MVAAALAASLAAGCASQPEDIQASYVSPAQYSSYDCDQLGMEMRRVSARVSEVSGQQQDEANEDAVATGVGLVLFWPALFFLARGGEGTERLTCHLPSRCHLR